MSPRDTRTRPFEARRQKVAPSCVGRVFLLLVPAVALLGACDKAVPARSQEGRLRIVKHFVAERYQSPGDASTASVPTAVVAGERRPVMSTSSPIWLETRTPPTLEGRQCALSVTIPPSLQGVPIAIDVQMLNADIEITDQQPRLVESPGDQ